MVLTEYGQLIAPVPAEDPKFNLSLGEGLLVGAQLVEWADHGVPLAEKYLAVSVPFAPVGPTTMLSMKRLPLVTLRRLERAMVESGMSVDNALIARQGQAFVAEPPGEVLGLMSRLGGSELVFATAVDDPRMGTGAGVPELWVTAGLSPQRSLDLVVINADPLASVTAEVVLDGLTGSGQAEAYVLDGPNPASYNTAGLPGQVAVTATTVDVGDHVFSWDFPAHSVTLLELVTNSAGYLVSHLQGRGHVPPGQGRGQAIR